MSSEGTMPLKAEAEAMENVGLPAISTQQRQLLSDVLGELSGPTLHNFTGDRREVWKLTAKATGPDVIVSDEATLVPIDIRHFLVHTVRIAKETPGEFVDAIRTVLIQPDGKQYAVVSDGVARDLAGLIHTFGMGPYDPPIEVQITPVRTRKGFKTYRLMPV